MGETKIRVCHVSEATSGGVLKHLIQLSENLDKEKFDQFFILSSFKNPDLKDNKHFYSNPLFIVDMVRRISPIADLISLVKITKILRSQKFDVVHCHSSKAGVLGRLAAFITGYKTIYYTPHSFSFNEYNSVIKNFCYASIEKVMMKITTKTVCVSNGEYLLAKKMKISKNEKFTVIPNGIEKAEHRGVKLKKDLLINFGFNGSEKIIGFVGRLCVQKNPEMLLKAFKDLSGNNTVLIIMGDGPLKQGMLNLADELEISDQVIFLGDIHNVREVLTHCDVLVSTSLWESMPYAILEAMAEGVPVIATEISGVTDIVNHNVTGLLIPPNNYAALANSLGELLIDDCRTNKIANNAKKEINNNYTIQRMIQELQKLYLS